jgi:thiol-disulfide isomerase/thioredoxin
LNILEKTVIKRSLTLLLFIFACSVNAETIFHDLQGNKIPFSSLSGKWVFINYWASWCHPCLAEIPELNRFYQKQKDNVVVFAVNYDALPLSEQLSLIAKLGISYPALIDDPSQSLQLGEITGVPITFVYNPQGKLMGQLYGSQTERDLNQVIKG